jgi:hypothetical protein
MPTALIIEINYKVLHITQIFQVLQCLHNSILRSRIFDLLVISQLQFLILITNAKSYLDIISPHNSKPYTFHFFDTPPTPFLWLKPLVSHRRNKIIPRTAYFVFLGPQRCGEDVCDRARESVV